MKLFEKLLKKHSSIESEKTFKLDSLGLIYPENENKHFRPKFVVIDYVDGGYDRSNYKYLNGRRCKKHWKKIEPGRGAVYVPRYQARRYLDIISDVRYYCYNLSAFEKTLRFDKCPLTLYIATQLAENEQLRVSHLQIPLEVINKTNDFFKEKTEEYNQKYNNANNYFIKNKYGN